MTLKEKLSAGKGEIVRGIFRLARFEVRVSKAGKEFGSGALADSSLEVEAKWWELTPAVKALCEQNTCLYVEASVDVYNQKPQLVVQQVRKAEESELEVALPSLVPCSPRRREDMLREVREIIEQMQNHSLQAVVRAILNRPEVRERFSRHPAALRYHHNFVSGLLQHVTELLSMAKTLYANDPNMDVELLYAAILLHDLGKVVEIEVDELGMPTGYSTIGKLLGHIFIGMEWVGQACTQLQAPAELEVLLKHCIYSHHGQPEWGSPVRPAIKEAQILHYLDNMSASSEVFLQEEEQLEPGGMIYSKRLQRDVYRPLAGSGQAE